MVETVIGGCAGGFESRNGVSKLVQMEKTWVALRFKMVVLLLWVQLKLLQAMVLIQELGGAQQNLLEFE